MDSLLIDHPLPWTPDESGDGYIWDADKEIVGSMGSGATSKKNLPTLTALVCAAPAMLDALKRVDAAYRRGELVGPNDIALISALIAEAGG